MKYVPDTLLDRCCSMWVMSLQLIKSQVSRIILMSSAAQFLELTAVQ